MPAMLSGLGVFLGAIVGLIALFHKDPTPKQSIPEQQHYLVVQSVKYAGKVRIAININGIESSYPASQPWTGDGYGSHEEQIPLPVDAETFQVTFTAIVGDPDPNFSGHYPTKLGEEKFNVKQLPTDVRTESGIPSNGAMQDLPPSLELKYRFK